MKGKVLAGNFPREASDPPDLSVLEGLRHLYKRAELIQTEPRIRMLGASWLVAAAVLCLNGPSAKARCSDPIGCLSIESTEQKLQCIRQCRFERESSRVSPSEDQRIEEQLEEGSLRILLSALSPLSNELDITPHSNQRRSYSMEHFRWGKPMGRKRRPVKVFTGNQVDDEDEHEEPEEDENIHVERRQSPNVQVQQRNNPKNNGRYRMTHFRWSAPPEKRYGGLASPYLQQSEDSLITLLRNVISDGQDV
ncbi:hypothetical protein DNTS_002197 [Danionella cerebrum]|uniref:Pro-opiomelanocortin/corticotropin ACTH central region domain-containing protein n=1 Tax=Danionella cerebrum TaxID=2873325 RepID=A0A553QAF9_9TELE|nr:hypothetical protein DNTS_002197 [Danionella translucida]